MTADANERIVRDFLAGWGVDMDTSVHTLETYLADDCIWENTGLATCYGKAEAIQALEAYHKLTGFKRLKVDLRNVVAGGRLVVTERVDHNLTESDEVIGGEPEPVLGIFEVQDGKIAAWRDYFDPRGFLGLWNAAEKSGDA